MTSVSAGHIILTRTQPVGSGRPQRESNPESPHQGSSALPTELPMRTRKMQSLEDEKVVSHYFMQNVTYIKTPLVCTFIFLYNLQSLIRVILKRRIVLVCFVFLFYYHVISDHMMLFQAANSKLAFSLKFENDETDPFCFLASCDTEFDMWTDGLNHLLNKEVGKC